MKLDPEGICISPLKTGQFIPVVFPSRIGKKQILLSEKSQTISF